MNMAPAALVLCGWLERFRCFRMLIGGSISLWRCAKACSLFLFGSTLTKFSASSTSHRLHGCYTISVSFRHCFRRELHLDVTDLAFSCSDSLTCFPLRDLLCKMCAARQPPFRSLAPHQHHRHEAGDSSACRLCALCLSPGSAPSTRHKHRARRKARLNLRQARTIGHAAMIVGNLLIGFLNQLHRPQSMSFLAGVCAK